MKISEKLLDKLLPVAAVIAFIAWLIVIVLAGVLSHSLIYSLLMTVAAGVFIFGLFRFTDLSSYDKRYSPKRFLYASSMASGLVLSMISLYNLKVGWMWVILIGLQLAVYLIYSQIKANEDRIINNLVEHKLNRERRVQMASQATNIDDYANALGLKVIRDKKTQTHISQFAGDLKCQHCGKSQRAKEWPQSGDTVPFYYQKEPGKYSLKLTCPHCSKIWYVAWDNDPGTMSPLS